jgi:hypothetical protein
MSDYTPIAIDEMSIRNWTSPKMDYDDVSTAEILLKIEAVETYVQRVFFRGNAIPASARVPVILLVVSNLLSNPTLARKYNALASETLGDYSYVMAPGGRGGTNPNEIIESWQRMAMEMLRQLQSPSDYQIRLTNE